jgi:hypothetical protein
MECGRWQLYYVLGWKSRLGGDTMQGLEYVEGTDLNDDSMFFEVHLHEQFLCGVFLKEGKWHIGIATRDGVQHIPFEKFTSIYAEMINFIAREYSEEYKGRQKPDNNAEEAMLE